MQIETEKDLRINQLRLIVFVLVAIFVAITTYTVYWLINYNKHFGFFQEVTAEVVDRVDMEGKTYDVLHYVVNDIEYKVTADVVSDNEKGDIITIYYDENNPLGIIYSLDNKRFILPIFSAVFGVLCVVLVVVYILIYRANKKSKRFNDIAIEKVQVGIIKSNKVVKKKNNLK